MHLSRRFNEADDEHARRDLEALPALLDRVDELLASGVIGGEVLNVADCQIATSLRLLMTLDDVRPAFAGRPCGDYALALVPEYPGYAPAALPADWKSPLVEAAPAAGRGGIVGFPEPSDALGALGRQARESAGQTGPVRQ